MEPNYEQLLKEEKEIEAGTSCKVRYIKYFIFSYNFNILGEKVVSCSPYMDRRWIKPKTLQTQFAKGKNLV